MRVKKILALLVLLASMLAARASYVDFYFTNFNASVTTNTPFQVFPVALNTNGTYLVVGLPIRIPATNGVATNKEFMPGSYELKFITSQNQNLFTSTFLFTVPADTNTYNVIALRVASTSQSGGIAYTQVASDARYVNVNTNIVLQGADTNLFKANSNLLNEAVAAGGGGVSLAQVTNIATTADAAQGVLQTNDTIAKIAAVGVLQTNDTLTRITTNNTAVGTANTNHFGARGSFIPVGMTFADDFERPNTTNGLGVSTSISSITAAPFSWYTNEASLASGNMFITNGAMMGSATTNDISIYPTVELPFKPNHFGVRLIRRDTGYSGAGVFPAFIFLLSPTNNTSFANSYHMVLNAGTDLTLGVYTNGAGLGFLTANMPSFQDRDYGGHSSGQSFVFQIWVAPDGTNILCDVGGKLYRTNWARLPDFGGRFFTPEIFNLGYGTSGATAPFFNLEILDVWAGTAPFPLVADPTAYQPLDADLTDLADGTLTASKIGTGLDATKIGAGGVTDAEFGRIGTLTSDAQTQLNDLNDSVGSNTDNIALLNSGKQPASQNLTNFSAHPTNHFANTNITVVNAESNSPTNKLSVSVSAAGAAAFTFLSKTNLATNIFTKTSSVTFTNTAVLFDTTNDIIAGFLNITANDGSNFFDILIHCDFTPFGVGASVSICQFQGAQSGGALMLIGEADNLTGRAKLKLIGDAFGNPSELVYTVEGYGNAMPTLAFCPDNAITPTYSETRVTVNGKISASALGAGSYVVNDPSAGSFTFVDLPATVAELVRLSAHALNILPSVDPSVTNLIDGHLFINGSVTNTGDLRVEGKIEAVGGVDPPYVLYDAVTRAQTKARVLFEVPFVKQTGAAQFYNPSTHKMEYYVASEDKFFDLATNTELASPTQVDVADFKRVLQKSKDDREKARLDAAEAVKRLKPKIKR